MLWARSPVCGMFWVFVKFPQSHILLLGQARVGGAPPAAGEDTPIVPEAVFGLGRLPRASSGLWGHVGTYVKPFKPICS